MSNIEQSLISENKSWIQRIPTIGFLFLSAVAVPFAIAAVFFLTVIILFISGIKDSDIQVRICLFAITAAFFGSIFFLLRWRRYPSDSNGTKSRTVEQTQPRKVNPLDVSQWPKHEPQAEAQIPAKSTPTAPAAAIQIAEANFSSEKLTERSSPPPPPPLNLKTSDDEDSATEIDASEDRNARMIDWLQSWKAPVFFGGLMFVGSMFLFQGNANAIQNMVWVSVAAGLLVLANQLRGIYFDGRSDKLSYPFYFFRRSLNLSEVADANCQTKSGEDDPLSFVIKLLGHTPTDRTTSKRYIVNLSGDFGARRIIFHSKYKRDQFLSLLRDFAPQTRITRWT